MFERMLAYLLTF